MVNYQESRGRFSEASLTTQSPKAMLKLLILQDRVNLLEAIERHSIEKSNNCDTTQELAVVKARLQTLLYDMRYSMEKQRQKDEMNKILQKINGTEKDIMELVNDLFEYMYQLNLTKIDVEAYDSTITEEEDLRKVE